MENNNLSEPEGRLREFVRTHWRPKPIDPPQPDPNVPNMNGPQRSAEVIRYSILSLEFWLSPLGKLREWVRLNSKLSAVLLIPALLVLPLIVFIFTQIARLMVLLVEISGNFILFPFLAFLATSIIAGIVLLLRFIFGR
jgi:hypothetical protein